LWLALASPTPGEQVSPMRTQQKARSAGFLLGARFSRFYAACTEILSRWTVALTETNSQNAANCRLFQLL
jgi:hypothetical protein